MKTQSPQPPVLHLQPVSPTDEAVVSLIEKLNQYQIALYGVPACNLEPPYELVRNRAYMVGAFVENTLAGIGAVKICDGYAEIKRMFVDEPYRGLSIAANILRALEEYVLAQGVRHVFLETGIYHAAAIKLYKKLGYQVVERFGGYKPNKVSVYFGKQLEEGVGARPFPETGFAPV